MTTGAWKGWEYESAQEFVEGFYEARELICDAKSWIRENNGSVTCRRAADCGNADCMHAKPHQHADACVSICPIIGAMTGCS